MSAAGSEDQGSRRAAPEVIRDRLPRARLLRRFFAAEEDGDLAGLEAPLAHDVFLTGDRRGKITLSR